MPPESPSRLQPKAQEKRVLKVVAYVVSGDRLLVFTHDDVPLEVSGVQVPAGSVEQGETPEEAVVREVFEETGLTSRIVMSLGTEDYGVWPYRAEIHERHFFLLELTDVEAPERWTSGEGSSSIGGAFKSWTCWWLPLVNAHVLCAGFGARIAQLEYSLAIGDLAETYTEPAS